MNLPLDTLVTISDTLKLNQTSILNKKDTINLAYTFILNGKDTDWWTILRNSVPTILLALLASFIALLQVKSNIVSSARIKWIEDLRNDISHLYNDALGAAYYWERYCKSNCQDKDEFRLYDEAHSNVFIHSNRIRMLLNFKEETHKELIKLLDNIDEIIYDETIKDPQDKIEIELKRIVEISREIFKKEWKKSKRIFKI